MRMERTDMHKHKDDTHTFTYSICCIGRQVIVSVNVRCWDGAESGMNDRTR